jgi:2,4-diaminopentanoate dehydrogenase
MADALGVELDEIRCVAEFAQTTEDLDLGSWDIKAGCVAGVAASWQGIRGGRTVVNLQVRWRKGRTLEPDWKVEHGYIVEIEGQPRVRTKLEIFPPVDFQARSFKDYMVLGMIMTSMPAVHAIPAVVAARPGIVTYADLPVVTARGFVSP